MFPFRLFFFLKPLHLNSTIKERPLGLQYPQGGAQKNQRRWSQLLRNVYLSGRDPTYPMEFNGFGVPDWTDLQTQWFYRLSLLEWALCTGVRLGTFWAGVRIPTTDHPVRWTHHNPIAQMSTWRLWVKAGSCRWQAIVCTPSLKSLPAWPPACKSSCFPSSFLNRQSAPRQEPRLFTSKLPAASHLALWEKQILRHCFWINGLKNFQEGKGNSVRVGP